MKILARRKKNLKMFDFSNYSAKSKYCNDSNKLVAGKMKYEAKGVAVEEFSWLQPKIYSFFVDDSSEHKIAKGGNKNAVAKISRNEYMNVLLNKNSVRHSMKRIQSKIIKYEPMKSTKFLCHTLMIKYISQTMVMID